ncbi:ectonucleoside triphosphate diphosphohydrolase 4 isoform X1 [Hyla sarda]|uniref:ectonucleoside triphosphate diphosphohydrolase 4 isoform X1 n=1 Tax=Hyla sarda TaxID=327740 RepID=UPI0024C3883F|nr:ectonucleoside triphosphate diphosphohydrolase 4 isoform X1 [Hyla sarda]XP_056427151.1 ectonucleoside triphosphate diphosphohydrolase 4 isoform X1 [Hyla sarda]XP_056427152.1 ectonucleoside triphosphate diphosphohydrolase 4 isoform X1 [Hyla sarda]
MGRLSISCLLPASWHFSISPGGCPRALNTTLRQMVIIGAVAGVLLFLIYSLLLARTMYSPSQRDRNYHRYLARVTDMEATDTSNPNINYGIVVDCGSSGSRIFVYCWPRHNGNPHDLLDIKQMRDQNRKTVVMKIKPEGCCHHETTCKGHIFIDWLQEHDCISELATTPEKASDYISPLLNFAASHIPREKHKETPLYILCTAGLRILTESQQEAILEDLRTDIPVRYDFLFSDSHTEVISGKQEGVYAWIGINFVLGRFDHIDDEDDAVVEVNVPGSDKKDAILRKRTAGILDMGGVSTQIAYEVPKSVSFASSQQEEMAKNLLAEFNLGCDAHETQHVYRVYVATFLGFGGNAARQRYEEYIFSSTMEKNRLLGKKVGLTQDVPYLDPCLPLDIPDTIKQGGQTMFLRGSGDFNLCRLIIQPLMNLSNETQTTLNGIYQPPLPYHNSEFYGFSEFYYCTEDVLRMGGDYRSTRFLPAAKDYCATKWSVLKERFDRGLYASHADVHRLKYQCFKSAWMYEVFHTGFSFPSNYSNLKTVLQVYDKEVQWTLGAILYRTRFLPLRDIQQEQFRGSHPHWRGASFVYNHYLFLVCFLVVLLSIVLYLLRLRRIHHRMQRNTSSSALWVKQDLQPSGLPSPI